MVKTETLVTGDALTVVTEVEMLTTVETALEVVVTVRVDTGKDELDEVLGLSVVVTVTNPIEADKEPVLAKTVVVTVEGGASILGVTVIVTVTTGTVLVTVTTLGAKTVLDMGLEVAETDETVVVTTTLG